MKSMRKIGNYCKFLANEKNITIETIAENLCYSTEKIEDFFIGNFILPFWKLEALAYMLNVSVSQILDATEDETYI